MADNNTENTTTTVPQTTEEKLAIAGKLKDEGNDFFKKGEFKKACAKYRRIFLYVEGLNSNIASVFGEQQSGSKNNNKQLTPEQAKILEIKVNARTNLAACYVQLKDWKKALEASQQALQLDSENAKALFRRGQAYLGKDDLDKAKKDFETVQAKLGEKAVANEMAKLKAAYARAEQRDKRVYANMFAKMNDE